MKIKNILKIVVKVLIGILIAIGVYLVLGSVGAHENNAIGSLQFFVQELIGLTFLLIAFLLGKLRIF